ncbi:TIM barrel protein [Pseudoclavibacter chungangensis]|uniref:TIM barrel protein n=1 Tax=Pseudoclavibacter chungangensis TaxID=587635 RepID=A0A7J5BM63_9MICO|nr:TIM barrel protein [Pseudoclavibacter chungangensis]KAB1652304.1 TIM barrel protein [Pseudoclavibacter chungangensis]NYJ66914.1 hydroxypyruvate isomerase [Pseudoclavibacter chungangensis]
MSGAGKGTGSPAEQSPFVLAACAEMLSLDLPFTERVRRIDDVGFEVEIWRWWEKDLDALAATGATFGSMSGYIRGELIDPDGADEIVATARESLDAAQVLDVPRLVIHGTGLDDNGLPVRPTPNPTPADWLAALRTLERLAALGTEYDKVFTLENLNHAVDHPGVPFNRASDTIALVAAVDSPHLRLNLDLYHAQIGEGDLVDLCGRAFPYIGEVQVADVPGRCEPGTGEIHYPRVARALDELGYRGVVAMEAYAADDADLALRRFREAFSIGA